MSIVFMLMSLALLPSIYFYWDGSSIPNTDKQLLIETSPLNAIFFTTIGSLGAGTATCMEGSYGESFELTCPTGVFKTIEAHWGDPVGGCNCPASQMLGEDGTCPGTITYVRAPKETSAAEAGRVGAVGRRPPARKTLRTRPQSSLAHAYTPPPLTPLVCCFARSYPAEWANLGGKCVGGACFEGVTALDQECCAATRVDPENGDISPDFSDVSAAGDVGAQSGWRCWSGEQQRSAERLAPLLSWLVGAQSGWLRCCSRGSSERRAAGLALLLSWLASFAAYNNACTASACFV
jgi:hypothetical protein